jgi:putative ABC transport system permease protein
MLDHRDTSANDNVALINESATGQLFSSEDPIGRRLRFNKEVYQIVGMVADTRQFGLARRPEPELYRPLAQNAFSTGGTLIVSLAGPAEQLIPLVKARVFAMSPDKPIRDISSLQETARIAAAPRRFNMIVLTIFALVAVAIAAIGVYGVMAYIVRRRTHEIGVRIALGAHPSDVRRMILTQGGLVIALGLAAGLAGAWYLARTIESFLFEARAQDVRIFATAAAVLALIGLAACWFPARRAAKVDPLSALRTL